MLTGTVRHLPFTKPNDFMNTHKIVRCSVTALILLYMTTPLAVAQSSMYTDPKAASPGDVLTIILAEQTSAERQTGWEKRSSASKGTGSSVGAGGLESQFATDAHFNSNTESQNQSVQSDALDGRFTASVVDLTDTGNLLIEGERRLNINGETHLMRVSGEVRPFDVRYNNSVLSYQIANANIEYREAGRRSRWFAPGLMVRVGAVTVAGLGIVLAVMN
jgi:flagellar L-ring protein precursor FlgH